MRRFNETYKYRKFISRNDWADTYKSIHAVTEEIVMLKVISNKSKEKEYINNLLKEVDILKKIKHPNLTSIHDIFKYEGIGQAHYYYIEGEYFKGISLKDKLNNEKLERNEAIKLVKQLAKVLEVFHKINKSFEVLNLENIIINPKGPKNPQDIMKIDILSYLENKRLKLNVAENIDELDNNENIEEDKFNLDKDMYSLGVILYSLLSGNINFENEKYKKHIEDKNLVKIIEKATNKELSKGYVNLNMFIEDLDSCLEYKELKSETYNYEEISLDNNTPKKVKEKKKKLKNKKPKKTKVKNKKSKKVLGVCASLLIVGTVSIKGLELLEKANNVPADNIKQESSDIKKEEEKVNKKEEKTDKEEVKKSEDNKTTTSNKSNNKKPSENTTSNDSNLNNNTNSNTNNNNNSNTEKPEKPTKPSNPDNNGNTGTTPKPDTGNDNNTGDVPQPPQTDDSTNNGSGGTPGDTPNTDIQE